MAILARVLMLVASLPLLFPPGFCICKVGGGVAPFGQAQVAGSQKIKPGLSKSGCCANRDCTGDHAARPVSLPGESKSWPGPTPQDDSHMPGCPAAAGADASKWVEPSQPFAHPLPPLTVFVVLPVDVVGRSRPPVPAPTNWPSSPPLYLSHCSLVI